MATTTEEVPMTDEDREGDEGFYDPAAGEDRSIEDMAGDEPEVEQYTLFGTAASVTGTVKGAKPTESQVKFKARGEKLPGQMQVDDLVELRVLARVDKVEFTTIRDGDGAIQGMKRLHHLTMIKVEQLGDVDSAFTEVDGR
jgi:hypothetical protein